MDVTLQYRVWTTQDLRNDEWPEQPARVGIGVVGTSFMQVGAGVAERRTLRSWLPCRTASCPAPLTKENRVSDQRRHPTLTPTNRAGLIPSGG